MKLHNVKYLLVLLGRDDFLQAVSVTVGLERLVKAVKETGEKTHLLVTGPVPRPHDRGRLLQDLLMEVAVAREVANKDNNISFIKFSEDICHSDQVIQSMFNDRGLTVQGRWLLLNNLPY